MGCWGNKKGGSGGAWRAVWGQGRVVLVLGDKGGIWGECGLVMGS